MRVYVIGGETTTDTWVAPGYARSVQCFDLQQEEWVDPGFPDYPGEAYSRYAVAAHNETTLIVAGGEMITDWYHEYGPLTGSCRQVFALNLESGSWTSLADLSEDEVYCRK